MTDCDNLIDRFHAQARTHVHLAAIAEAAPVAEMHIEMALFSAERARAFEELCDDGLRPQPDTHTVVALARKLRFVQPWLLETWPRRRTSHEAADPELHVGAVNALRRTAMR